MDRYLERAMEHTSRPQPLVIAAFFACLAPTMYSNMYSFGRHDNLVFSVCSIDRTGERAARREARRGATVVEVAACTTLFADRRGDSARDWSERNPCEEDALLAVRPIHRQCQRTRMVIFELPAADPAADRTRNGKFDAAIYG